jgi:outer membrane protein OmpA-like peptidoglycan-associated protein
VSDNKNNPNQPPPDDFSETRPSINLPKDAGGQADWEKTNYNYSPQPPSDDWGKTVANYNIPPQDEPDFNKTYLPSNQPRNSGSDDWAMTQANIKLPSDFGTKPEDFRETQHQQSRQENFDLTTPLIRLPEAERAKYQNLPPTPAEEAARAKEEEKKKGGIPAWVFIAGGLMMMFIFTVVVLVAVRVFFLNNTGFELVLKAAPIGSDVYIDGQGPWGVTNDDGSIKLPVLRAGETKKIEIRHPNYNCKPIEITGQSGVVMEKIADCTFLKPTDDCANIKSTDVEKSERCAVQALEKLGDPPSIDELLKALSMQIINFESGSFQIPPQRLDFLQKAAVYINKLPPTVVIEVGGHTDDRGSDALNQKLSENRAGAVRDALIKFGVSAERLTAKGYGKIKPKVPNTDDESRAKNRRIEYTAVKR